MSQMPFSDALFSDIWNSSWMLLILYTRIWKAYSLLFDKEYVVLPFASPLIPWFLRCWQVWVKNWTLEGHQKSSQEISAPELLRVWCGPQQVWGISKQINELKYVPVSTPYFVSSLEIGLWVKHVPSRIQLDCMNLAQVKHVLLLCLVGSWVLCLLFAPKDLWALVLGICTPCKALRLGDIDDLLRLETCLGSSFWPWSLSRIRTPSYTGSLYKLFNLFCVCSLCPGLTEYHASLDGCLQDGLPQMLKLYPTLIWLYHILTRSLTAELPIIVGL